MACCSDGENEQFAFVRPESFVCDAHSVDEHPKSFGMGNTPSAKPADASAPPPPVKESSDAVAKDASPSPPDASAVTVRASEDATPALAVSGLPMTLQHRYGVQLADDTLMGALLLIEDTVAVFFVGSLVRLSCVDNLHGVSCALRRL